MALWIIQEMKKIFIVLLLALLILPFVASIDVYKQNSIIDLKVSCANINCSSNNNITIVNPDSTILVDNQAMSSGVGFANYSFNATNIGTYNYYVIDTNSQSYTNSLQTTATGNASATGSITIFFIGLFLILIGLLLYLLIVGLAHSFNFEYDVVDLAINWGIYFVLFGAYTFERTYLGDATIESLMPIILQVTAVTHLLIPAISLGVSMLVGTLMKQKANYGRLDRIQKRGYRYG